MDWFDTCEIFTKILGGFFLQNYLLYLLFINLIVSLF